jgi:hypothetical protein
MSKIEGPDRSWASGSLDRGSAYVNQRRVLMRRASLVEVLYAEAPVPGVIVAEGPP